MDESRRRHLPLRPLLHPQLTRREAADDSNECTIRMTRRPLLQLLPLPMTKTKLALTPLRTRIVVLIVRARADTVCADRALSLV